MAVVASMALGSAAGAEGMADPGNAATWALSFQNASTEEAPAGSTRAWRGLLGLDTMPRVVDSSEPQAILINLPITGELPAVLGRTVVGPQGGVTWYGTIDDGTDASFVLAQVGDAIAGAIWHPTWGTIEIRPTGEYSSAGQRQSLMLLIDPEAVIDCSTGGVFHEHSSFNADVGEIDVVDATVTPRRGVVGGPAACGCGDDGSIIDIMVVYTPIARDSAGGTSAIQAIAMASVASINTSFANSGLEDTMVRLVHIHETDFMETQDVPSGDFRAALSRQGDGFMDEVGLLRDQYAADLVALLVNNFGIPGLGGNAFVSPGVADRGVSVTRWNVALGPLIFAHEVGHNFGCQHDIDAYDTLPDQYYALGHKFRPVGSGLQRTVMAYFPGTAVPQFSNPDVSIGGASTGLIVDGADRRHNARVIRETRRSVANFRQSAEAFSDCNRNGVNDIDDITSGFSLDLNGNGMPDECEVRLYVNASAPDGGDGLTWESAFNDLTDAIGTPRYLCDNVTEVWVAAGTYRVSGPNNNKWDRFFVGPHLRLLGGFAGGETSADQRNPAVNLTVLSGDRLQNDLPGQVNMEENSINVIRLTGAKGAVIDGFTIRDGNARTKPGGRFVIGGTEGSAINGLWSTASIANCIIEDNFGHWGTVLLGSGRASIVNSLFRNNRVAPIAGGPFTVGAGLLIFDDSDVTVINSTMGGNEAVDGIGGAIAASESTLLIRNSVLWGNPAGLMPGPLTIDDNPLSTGSTLTIDHSIIEFGSFGLTVPPGSNVLYDTSNSDSDPMFVDAVNADYSLAPGSVGVDAGSTAALDPLISRDIAGNPRIVGQSVDIGAFESAAICAVDLTGDGTVNFFDVTAFLGEFNQQSSIGDWNSDGRFDFFDIAEFLADFNGGCA